jgi:hypothetical protein
LRRAGHAVARPGASRDGFAPLSAHCLKEAEEDYVAKKSGYLSRLVVALLSLAPCAAPAENVTTILPSSVFRSGLNAAQFQTDVRIQNLGNLAVTVTATLYDQATKTTFPAQPFVVAARSQASFDNVLQSLFGRTLGNGSFGPIRFESTGPIVVSASVNNVNACGNGATSGQWLPGLDASQALTAGAVAQLAVSANGATGYRTNLVAMNPGSAPATVTVKVRGGSGTLLSTGTLGPLAPNGFLQVALDSGSTFPGVAGRTDTNLWVEFTSDHPVLVFASVINNASGDPFAVVATADPANVVPPVSSAWDGSWRGNTAEVRTVSFDIVGGRVVKVIYGGYAAGNGNCIFDTFLTITPGSVIDANGSFTFSQPAGTGSYGVTGTATLNSTAGTGTGIVSYTVPQDTLPAKPTCTGTGSAQFTVTRIAPTPVNQVWDGTWRGNSSQVRAFEIDVLNNRITKVVYGGYAAGNGNCIFDTFFTPQPGYPIGPNGSFTFTVPKATGAIGINATGNLRINGTATGVFDYDAALNSIPAKPTCAGDSYAIFTLTRTGGAPPVPSAAPAAE